MNPILKDNPGQVVDRGGLDNVEVYHSELMIHVCTFGPQRGQGSYFREVNRIVAFIE